jgi:hypothetical protein
MNELAEQMRRFVQRHPGNAVEDRRLLALCDEIDRLQKLLDARARKVRVRREFG